MKPRITFASVDRLQSAVDSAARLHRLGLFSFVVACVSVSLPPGTVPAWVPLVGMAATVLAFAIKAEGTLREIRLASTLAKVMALPYKRLPGAGGHDSSAWAAIRSYVLVSVALTVAAALAPSMLVSVGETPYALLTVTVSMAALAIQSFDNPRRLHTRIMQICAARVDWHGDDDGNMVA